MFETRTELVPFALSGRCPDCSPAGVNCPAHEGIQVIRATSDIANSAIGRNVRSGEFGAAVPKEANVTLCDDGWIERGCVIHPDAYIEGSCYVSGSIVSGQITTAGIVIGSTIYDTGSVSGDACCQYSYISGDLVGNAVVRDCTIPHHAVVSTGMEISTSGQLFTLSINGMHITAVNAGNAGNADSVIRIQAGCQRFDVTDATPTSELEALARTYGWDPHIVAPVRQLITQYFRGME